MSLDGRIATFGGESELSSPEDLKRVHGLRARVDGIMVGVGTLLADNPKLTVRLVNGRNPKRIIIDSRARTPLNALVVKSAKQTPTIVATTSRASAVRVARLQKAGVTVLRCGKGSRVLLPLLMDRLRKMGVRKLLLEGAGPLTGACLARAWLTKSSLQSALESSEEPMLWHWLRERALGESGMR